MKVKCKIVFSQLGSSARDLCTLGVVTQTCSHLGQWQMPH
jgi:hypothetical protein